MQRQDLTTQNIDYIPAIRKGKVMGRAEDLFERIKQGDITVLDDLILQRKSEDLFLDFKVSADAGNGGKLHASDRNNLAKSISAFGNSSGGVIIWGIDCSHNPHDTSDLPRGRVPITDVARFIGRLESATSGCTMPPHPKITHHPILLPNSKNGFVATLVPESYLAPHQNLIDDYYYIRAGSNCVHAPHGVLAGMFGRKPTPNLYLMFMKTPAKLHGPIKLGSVTESLSATFQFGFVLAHQTPVIARDLYFSFQCMRTPGPKCKIEWLPDNSGKWEGNVSFGVRFSVNTIDRFKLPPETHTKPGVLNITLAPPFESDLKFQCWWGCADSPVQNLQHVTKKEALTDAWLKFVTNANGSDPGTEFTDIVLPLGK